MAINLFSAPSIFPGQKEMLQLEQLQLAPGQLKQVKQGRGEWPQLGTDEWTAIIERIFFRFSPNLNEYSAFRLVCKQFNKLWTTAANSDQALKDVHAHKTAMFLLERSGSEIDAAVKKALDVEEFLSHTAPNQNPLGTLHKMHEQMQYFLSMREALSISIKSPCVNCTIRPESSCSAIVTALISASGLAGTFLLDNDIGAFSSGFVGLVAFVFFWYIMAGGLEAHESAINEFYVDNSFNIELSDQDIVIPLLPVDPASSEESFDEEAFVNDIMGKTRIGVSSSSDSDERIIVSDSD